MSAIRLASATAPIDGDQQFAIVDFADFVGAALEAVANTCPSLIATQRYSRALRRACAIA